MRSRSWFSGTRAGWACVLLFVPAMAIGAETKSTATKGPKVTYDDNVKPIFREKCAACHNTDKKTAGLDLTNYTGVMTGGGSGAVIEPGSSGDSYLFSLVSHTSEPHMPPKSDKLPPDILATIAKWIDGGALENSGSKAVASKKPKVDFALKAVPSGRPAGPPPLPERLSLEPVVRTERSTASRTIATNPWSPLAAIAGQKQVLLYNTKTLDLAGVLPFPEGTPYVLKFSQNGLLLLAGGGHSAKSGRVVVWNVKTGERVFEIGDELDAVLGADISADQSLIALGGPGKVVRVYSTADGALKYEMKKHTDWIYSIAFSPDGVLLATADRNGGIVVWEAKTGREFLVLAGHNAAVTALSWRIDSNILASGSEDTVIKLWEMENGNQVKNWGAHGGGVTAVDFTRDGRLVSCGRDRLARLWDQNGAAKVNFGGFTDIPLSVAYCDETNRLIAGDWTGGIRVYNGADGKQIGSLDADPPTLVERLHAAEKSLATLQTENKNLATALAAAQTESQKHKQEHEVAQKAVEAAHRNVKAAADAAAKTSSAIAALNGEIQTANKLTATLGPALPILKEAADKGAQAVGKVPGDKELAAAADQVKAQYAQKSKLLDDSKKAITEKTARLEKLKPELAAAAKHLSEAKASLEAAEKKAVDPAQVAKNTFDASTQRVAMAQNEIVRWKEEIAFRDKALAHAAIQAKALQLAEGVQTAQAAYDAAKGEVAKLQQGVVSAQKASDLAATGVKKSQDLVTQLTAEHASAVRRGGLLDALIPALNETLVKAEEASRRAPGDADVTSQVAEIKSLIAKKMAETELTKKTAVEKTKAIESAKGQIPVAEKKLADSKTAIEAAKKKVIDATAGLKPLEDKIAAAKSVMAEGAKTVEASKKELDAMKLRRST